MSTSNTNALDRRDFLTRAVPACAAACFGLGSISSLAAMDELSDVDQDLHKFDKEFEQTLTSRRHVGMSYGPMIGLINILQSHMSPEQVIEILNDYSAAAGRSAGARNLADAEDNSFESFVTRFRPPNYAETLTHEVVEDTGEVLELRVTECVWASVFSDAGLGGEVGHAAICNMDYHWPPAFNPAFKMERNRTLMQGHDHCNHRYIDSA